MNTVVEEPAGQENGLPEPEFDWSLDATELSTAEQEARFARSRTGRVFTKVYTPCPVCDMRHQLSFCPFVFEDNPRHLSKPKDKTRGFEERMEKSKEFRDAVEYLRKTFTRRDLTLRHVAVPNYQTQDAPPPARAWLSRFSAAVNLYGDTRRGAEWAWEHSPSAFSHSPGYFPTTDDDGRPFLILFANSGHLDERLPYEIDIIRTFVAEYNRGAKNYHGRSPDDDTRPIGIVIVAKRWHVPRSTTSSNFPGISIGIASEYSWLHGYARWGIHISASMGRVEKGFFSWTMGRQDKVPETEDPRGIPFIDWLADSASPHSNTDSHFMAALGYGLLRDVREPAEQVEVQWGSILGWDRIYFWRRMLLHRAATFYGTSSPQYRALYAGAQGKDVLEAVFREMTPLDALPRWKHIQSRISMAGKPYEEQTVWRSVFQ